MKIISKGAFGTFYWELPEEFASALRKQARAEGKIWKDTAREMGGPRPVEVISSAIGRGKFTSAVVDEITKRVSQLLTAVIIIYGTTGTLSRIAKRKLMEICDAVEKSIVE